jgi:hypothetical protein
MTVVPMMVAPRPVMEVKPWAVKVPAVPVSWAVPMTPMPEATMAHLLDVCVLARDWLEASRYAAGRCSLSRHREEPQHKRGCC